MKDQNKSFFQQNKIGSFAKNKLYIVIGLLILLNLFTVKGLISVAENKTVVVQVPQVMEAGNYSIGANDVSNNVLTMWAKVWTAEIGNYNYKNIDKKVAGILPFFGGAELMKSKAALRRFITQVTSNYLSARSTVQSTTVERINSKYKKVSVVVKQERFVGRKHDSLSNANFIYEYTVFARNGQVYIENLIVDLEDSDGEAAIEAQDRVDASQFLLTTSEERAERNLRKRQRANKAIDTAHIQEAKADRIRHERAIQIKKLQESNND